MPLKPLTASPVYDRFTSARDRALEKILHVHLSAIDCVMGKLKRKVLALSHLSPAYVEQEIRLASVQTAELAKRLRRQARLLAHASEVKAITQTLGRTPRGKAGSPAAEMPSGGTVEARIGLAFARLKRRIDDAVQLNKTLEGTHAELLERVARAFPPERPRAKSTPALSRRKLHVVTEARSPFQSGFYAEDEWQDILDDYQADVLPASIFARGPNDDVLFFDVDTEENEIRYQWEVEQEITEDFVRQVREGTHEAAKQNGIEDFEWVAIVDSHTDECCTVRDGLTSQEIEERLESGEIDDECDAVVAPAHFNCRCKSVPMAVDVPDQAPADTEEFDDWLNNKAA